jgi:hypothetical protein
MNMKLDYKKWRAALDAAGTAEQITELLCIRAHIKGKIHRHRARLDYTVLIGLKKLHLPEGIELSHNGGSMIVGLNGEDQAILFAEKAEQYVKIEPVVAAACEIRK